MTIIFGFLAKFIASAAFGSITGFIGSWLKGKQEITKQLEQNKFELAKMQANLEMQKLEIAGALKRANIDADRQRDVADAKALVEAQKQDKRAYSQWTGLPSWIKSGLGITDIMRGQVRIVLSYFAAICFFLLIREFLSFVSIENLLNDRPDTFWKIYEYTIQSAVFLMCASIGYWFGTRPMKVR